MADLPDGQTPPVDGRLPAAVADGAAGRDLGMYVHVPFCVRRCGYCDFTTYTNAELGGGADLADYARTAAAEVALAGRVLSAEHLRAAGMPEREVSTVFVGGGTPTTLPTADLAALLGAVTGTFGLAAGAEVTTEANPDSVDAASLAALAAAGFTRVSFGMQSAVPHVLATLDRTHDPQRVPQVVAWARDAGLQVSLDLIYGTPGESDDDWRRSLDAVVAMEPDHVSAYALVVEPGTKMGAQVRRGELPLPDDDAAADRYEAADAVLGAAGYHWYEVSNWARDPAVHACRHNLAYWRGQDWWGIGPGAHSHVGGLRWWNTKHPRAYAQLLAAGRTPSVGRELLDAATREEERVLLGVRLAEGLPLGAAQLGSPRVRSALADLVADGLIETGPLGDVVDAGGGPGAGGTAAGGTGPAPAVAPRVVLTLRGRLLADAVVRALA